MLRRPFKRGAGTTNQAGYLELVRTNPNFRFLWIGDIISLLGDWFNTIAIYNLITELTGSPLALGAVFITKMLPWALASPVAGVIVDRVNRRRLMIGSDLLRAIVVLGFLAVDEPGDVWLLYVLTALQTTLGSVFQPARSASLPNITSPRELLTANALMSATWSTMLAMGAALGGFATEFIGTTGVFLADSATYVLSALFLYRVRIPQQTEPVEPGPVIRAAARKTAEGWRHMRQRGDIGRIALSKFTWSVAGGGLVYMLALLGEAIAPTAQAIGIGILYSARGLGTGIGPIIARRVFRDKPNWPRVLGCAVMFSGLCYFAVGFAEWGYAVAGLIILAHAASGANWVLSSVLLQERTADWYRGRVFATEWLLVLIAESISTLIASTLLESGLLDLRGTFRVFAGVMMLCGLLWLLVIVPRERRARVAGPGGHPRDSDLWNVVRSESADL